MAPFPSIQPKSCYPPLAGFLLGILLTLGFKDIYPDLERRFRRHWNRNKNSLPSSQNRINDNIDENHANARDPQKRLTKDGNAFRKVDGRFNGIVDGIEGTIGNTPLIRIKSLSEATGCEILGKAEVGGFLFLFSCCLGKGFVGGEGGLLFVSLQMNLLYFFLRLFSTSISI